MATQKPISTISYCRKEFIIEKLDNLIKQHVIQCYQFICHVGEYNEELKKYDKNHIHLRIEPNVRIDPMDLTDLLTEYVNGENLPRKCKSWKSSKEEDWLLYAVHDKDYMKLKYPGDTAEKLPYEYKDIVVSDGFDVETAFTRAKIYLKHTTPSLIAELQSGVSPVEIVKRGENVFTVNQVSRLLYNTNYTDLLNENQMLKAELTELQQEYSRVMIAIDKDNKSLLKSKNGEYKLIDKVFKE